MSSIQLNQLISYVCWQGFHLCCLPITVTNAATHSLRVELMDNRQLWGKIHVDTLYLYINLLVGVSVSGSHPGCCSSHTFLSELTCFAGTRSPMGITFLNNSCSCIIFLTAGET